MLKGIKYKQHDEEEEQDKEFLNRKMKRDSIDELINNSNPSIKQKNNHESEVEYENILNAAFEGFINFDNKTFIENYTKLEQFKNSKANKISNKPIQEVIVNNTTGNPLIEVDLDNDDDDDMINPNIDEINFDKFKEETTTLTNDMKNELIKMQQFNQFERGLGNVYFSRNKDKELKDQMEGTDKEITKPSVRQERRKQTILASCERCSGAKLNEYSIISQSENVYLAYPYREGSIAEYHFVLSTLGHVNSQASLEENVFHELRNYIKSIVSFNLNRDMTTIFLEFSRTAGHIGHFEIEAFPIKHKLLEDARMYFKKAFMDQDYEWAINKTMVDTTPYKGNLTKIINENFSYVNVDFNGQGGYLHIIEDERRFSQTFLKEILCPILKLNVLEVKYPKKLGLKELVDTVQRYKDFFKSFDWTYNI
jgi:hypothetical protein